MVIYIYCDNVFRCIHYFGVILFYVANMCIYKGDYVKTMIKKIGSSPSEQGPSSSVSAKY